MSIQTISLSQLAKQSDLPIKWLKKNLPMGSKLVPDARGDRWEIPYINLDDLIRRLRQSYEEYERRLGANG